MKMKNKALIFVFLPFVTSIITSCNNGGDVIESIKVTTKSSSYAESQEIKFDEFNVVAVKKNKSEQAVTDFTVEEFNKETSSYTFTSADHEAGSKTFTVTHKTFRGATKVAVTARIPVTDLKIDRHVVLLDEKSNTRTVQLSAAVYPNNATNKAVEWETSNKHIAEVSQSGLVSIPTTTHATGDCYITAKSKDSGVSDYSYTINVGDMLDKHVESVTLPKTLEVNQGDKKQLTATVLPDDASIPYVVWKSSDESIATVDDSGFVTGVKEGEVTISAIAVDGYKQGDCKVTVKAKPIYVEGITLNYTELNLEVGASMKLAARVMPTNATNKKVIFSSSNYHVASVGEDSGMIYTHKAGTCTITVKSAENETISKTCDITVMDKHVDVTEINPSPTEIKFENGASLEQQIIPTVIPTDASDKRVTFISEDTTVATVDEFGIVRPRPGNDEKTTNICVQSISNPNVQAKVKVTVAKGIVIPLTGLGIEPEILVLKTGEGKTLTPVYYPSYTTQKGVKFELEGDEIFKKNVSIDENTGFITGTGSTNSRGRVKISSTVEGKKDIVGYCTVGFIGIPTIKFKNTIRNVNKGPEFGVKLEPYSSNDPANPLDVRDYEELSNKKCHYSTGNAEFDDFGTGILKASKKGYFDGIIQFDISTFDQFEFEHDGSCIKCNTSIGTKVEELYMPTSIYHSDSDSWTDVVKVLGGIKGFEGRTFIKKVTLGAKIQHIEDEAFKDCINLEYFDTNELVHTIGKDAFLGCHKLAEIVVRSQGFAKLEHNYSHIFDYVDTIKITQEALNAVSDYSYIKKEGLVNCIIEDPDDEKLVIAQKGDTKHLYLSETSGGVAAYIKDENVGAVNIPAYVMFNGKVQPVVKFVEINDEPKCSELTLPHTIKSVGSIKGNKTITTIDMSRCYQLENLDGVEFSNNPNLESFAFPTSTSIKKIPNYMFKDDQKLSIHYVPDSVTEFGKEAFRNIHDGEFEYPSRLNMIGEKCFQDCDNTGSVYFKQVGERWEEVKLTIWFSAYSKSGLTSVSFSPNIYYLRENAFDSAPVPRAKWSTYCEYRGSKEEFKNTRLDDTSYEGAKFCTVFGGCADIMHCEDGDFDIRNN